jgi:hypothetical protein
VFVGAALIELIIPGAASLKDKRRVVKGFKDRLRARHGMAVAEVGAQDLWQRAVILVSTVGQTQTKVEEDLALVRRQADGLNDAECLHFDISVHAYDDLIQAGA